MSRRGKILILIIAYNARSTLAEVIDRIELEATDDDVHGLIIDDASGDSTFEVGRALAVRSKVPLTVLQTPSRRGYGGIQKLGFHYAIKNGYRAVALLHGDGRYAPEKLGELAAPVLAGEADAVFGSRRIAAAAGQVVVRQDRAAGALPRVKRVANRLLSPLQNRLLGQRLSELHCGYRVYSVAALERLPFEYNTDDFHFDTEIIIQLTDAGLRIAEVPIPFYSGDELGWGSGIAYAWKAVAACGAYWLHRRGVFYHYNFDASTPEATYELKIGYPSSHTLAVDRVVPGSTVVDLACSTGYVAEVLHRDKGCRVFGVDLLERSSPCLAGYHRLDLNTEPLPESLESADWVLLLDILEHLADPEEFLLRLRGRVRAGETRILITVPNVGYAVTRLMLLLGQWNYGKRGILDKTHTRLFTFSSLVRLLRQAGFEIHRLRGIPAPFPKALGDNLPSRWLLGLNGLAIGLKKRLFAYQIYAEVTALATVENLVAETERHSRRASAGRPREPRPPPQDRG